MKADRLTDALSGVALWQKFVEQEGLSAEEKSKGEAELKVWSDRVDDDAAIINKKWVGGKEKKAIEEKVRGLIGEYQALVKQNQSFEAVKKLQDAAKIWPENFSLQFELGSVAMGKQNYAEAIQKFEACLRITPNSPMILNNLGACYVATQRGSLEKGIFMLMKSVRAKETKENVYNLALALSILPEAAQRSARYKEPRETLNLVATRHDIKPGETKGFMLMRPEQDSGVDVEKGKGEKERDSVFGNGSGFIISPEGLILTNKHVGGHSKGLLIKFSDGTQKTGELMKADDEQDLALIRVKGEKPFPYVKFAKYDNPPDGMAVIVMGFPLADKVGFAMKTTRGIVSAGANEGYTSDVTLDCRVNPGNSGGPVYNEYGHIIAIIAQKTVSQGGMEDTYGLAISNGRIRKFLKKNNVKIEEADESPTGKLDAQGVNARNKPATVLILMVGKSEE
jgi:S1-C subfamily serine protease